MNYFKLLPLILLLSSCAETDDFVSIVDSNEVENTNVVLSRYFSQSEADSLAIDALNKYCSNNRVSRSASCRSVKHSYVYESAKSRNGDVDTTFYVVNMAPDGFALIAADRRMKEPVCGFSEHGYISETPNPAFQYYLDVLKEDISIKCEESANSIIPVASTQSLPLQPYDPSELSIIEIDGVKYYSSTSDDYDNVDSQLLTAWHQRKPFNRYCLDKDGTNVDAGCVAIALAQILSYHKTQFGSRWYNWDEILSKKFKKPVTENGEDDAAHLVHELGMRAGIKYWDGESGSNIYNAQNVLDEIGFKNTKIISKWENRILNSIKEYGPVYMRGVSQKGGHAWVIDGYKYHRNTIYYYTYEDKLLYGTSVTETIFLSMNWGWDGNDDGFFRQASSYATSEAEFSSDLKYLIDII